MLFCALASSCHYENLKKCIKILISFRDHDKLLLNYLMIILQLLLTVNTKTIYGKGIPSMSKCVARSKVPDHSNLKILSPKQMFQY